MAQSQNNLKKTANTVRKTIRVIRILSNPFIWIPLAIFLGIFIINIIFQAFWQANEKEANIRTNNIIMENIDSYTTLASGEDGYYYKIDKENFLTDIERKMRNKGVIIKSEFGSDDYQDKLFRMIVAQEKSKKLRLGDREDIESGLIQGIIEIQRNDYEGNKYDSFKYLPYGDENTEGTFMYKLKNNDEDVLNYFTFESEDKGVIYYATKSVNEESISYNKNSFNYSSVSSNFGISYSFLFGLLQMTENVEWIDKVVDMALQDSSIIIMIQDTRSYSVTDTYYDYRIDTERRIYKKEENQEEKQPETSPKPGGGGGGGGGSYQISYNAENTSAKVVRLSNSKSITSSQIVGTELPGFNPDGETTGKIESTHLNPIFEQSEHLITVRDSYSTITYVQSANTWCIAMEQEYEKEEKFGEEIYVSEEHDIYQQENPVYNYPKDAGYYDITVRTCTKSTTTTTTTNWSYKAKGDSNKKVNSDMFLGILKNAKGTYSRYYTVDSEGNKKINEDAVFKNDGIAVKYATKNGNNENPISLIEIRYDIFMDILKDIPENQYISQFFQYMLYIYTGKAKYEIDIDKLLNSFGLKKAGGGLYGATTEEKIWWTLLDAGYSKECAAGVLGNIACESGFRTNNLEDGSNTKANISDDEFTSKVDSGEISKDEFLNSTTYGIYPDKGYIYGYGLCQWTSTGRKRGLYDYAKSQEKSIADENIQIKYLLGEMNPNGDSTINATYQMGKSYEGHTRSEFVNAKTPEMAARSFAFVFERNANQDKSERETKARGFYEKFKDLKKPQGITYQYYQQDYSYVPYGPPGGNVGCYGCAITGFAMIASTIKNEEITPEDIINLVGNTYWTSTERIWYKVYVFKGCW